MGLQRNMLKTWEDRTRERSRYGATLITGRERFKENLNSNKEVTEDIFLLKYEDKNKKAVSDDSVIKPKKNKNSSKQREEYVFNRQGKEMEQKSETPEKNLEETKTKEKVQSKFNLNDMEEEILKVLKIIKHDGGLYVYTGWSYKIIKNSEELLCLIRAYVSPDAFGSISTNRFNDLMVFLNADSRLIPKNYEKKILESQYYISFRNGILDVRTLRLYKHSDKYLVFYELDAYWYEEAYPSKFLGFVKQASGNDESVMKRMVESIGYLLSSVNDGKYFFVMGTERDSGKSTLGKLLEIIVGHSYIAHLSTYQMGNRFAFGDIHGKTLNLSMDLPKGKLTPVVVSIIKQITGGDAITTDQKYERMREAHSNMRFLFATNHPVMIPKEEDDAFWNRMVIIPFQHSVEKSEMDHELLQKLLDEKDDIISLCLTALHKMLKGGCNFSECRVAEEMKRQWRKYESDLDYTLNSFFDECIKVTGNQEDSLYAQDLFDAYQRYCENNNLNHMDYKKVLHWCESNLPECRRKRIHHTGENPKSGFVGMQLIDGKQ